MAAASDVVVDTLVDYDSEMDEERLATRRSRWVEMPRQRFVFQFWDIPGLLLMGSPEKRPGKNLQVELVWALGHYELEFLRNTLTSKATGPILHGTSRTLAPAHLREERVGVGSGIAPRGDVRRLQNVHARVYR